MVYFYVQTDRLLSCNMEAMGTLKLISGERGLRLLLPWAWLTNGHPGHSEEGQLQWPFSAH